MKSLCILGFDPPRGWSVWLDGELAAAGQVEGDSVAAAMQAFDAAWSTAGALNQGERRPVLAAVEVPYGLGGEATVKSMLVEAEGAGVIRGALLRSRAEVFRLEVATWRAAWKFPGGLNRKDCKDLSARIAEGCIERSSVPYCRERSIIVGPKGGLKVDAMEAICIGGALVKLKCF